MKYRSFQIKFTNFFKLLRLKLNKPFAMYATAFSVYFAAYGYFFIMGKNKSTSTSTSSLPSNTNNQLLQDNHNIQKLLTKTTQQLANIKIPRFLREYIYKKYAEQYKVNLDEIQKQLVQYQSFSEFFTRKVVRNGTGTKNSLSEEFLNQFTICCPCDGEILALEKVSGDQNIIIKDIKYSLNKLLFQQKDTQPQSHQLQNQPIQKIPIKKNIVQQLKKNPQTNTQLYQIIFYLSPKDYHRFHSPYNLYLEAFRNIEGMLKAVNVQSLIRNGGVVYEENARKVMHGRYRLYGRNKDNEQVKNKNKDKQNKNKNVKKMKQLKQQQPQPQPVLNYKDMYLGLVMIGALNVSNIYINQKIVNQDSSSHDPYNQKTTHQVTYRKGQQIGYFNLGSTIVMLIQVPQNIKWYKNSGDRVQYGDRLCEFL